MTRFFAAALATAMLTPQAQTPLQQSAATATTGVIRGHIFTADGRPLQRAQVRLLNLTGGGGMLRNVDTDDDGSYQFADVRAGVYMVIASHNGFVTFAYGRQGNYPQTDTGIAAAMAIGPDQVFTLGQGETKEHVDITLPRHGAIVGHIVDENGDPVEGVNVRALKIAFTAGRRQLVGAGSVSPKTNDQGRFRIYGLQPGSYIVSADVGHAGSQDLPGYAATYFPGTSNPGEAQPVTVGVSQEVTNVDFALTPVRTASDAAGRPVTSGAALIFSSDRDRWYEGSRFFSLWRLRPGGLFTVQGMPPGDYFIAAIDWLQPGDLVGGWQDPALLESLSRDATRVTLTEGQKVSVSLKLSPR